MDDPLKEKVMELVNTKTGKETVVLVKKYEEEGGQDLLKQLVLRVPGFVLPIFFIKRLEFSFDLWTKLYNKRYFANKNETDFWTEPENVKKLAETKFEFYFKALNEKVFDRDYLKTVKKEFTDRDTVMNEKFHKEVDLRLDQLTNSIDFILKD